MVEVRPSGESMKRREDIASEMWEHGVQRTNCVPIGSHLYAIGGLSFKLTSGRRKRQVHFRSKVIKRMAPSGGGRWETIHIMPFYCSDASVAVSGDLIYVFRGPYSDFFTQADGSESLPIHKWAYVYHIKTGESRFLTKPSIYTSRSISVHLCAPVPRATGLPGILVSMERGTTSNAGMFVHDPITDQWYTYSEFCGREEMDSIIPLSEYISSSTLSSDGNRISYLQIPYHWDNESKPIITSYLLSEGKLQFQVELDLEGFDNNGNCFTSLLDIGGGRFVFLGSHLHSSPQTIQFLMFSVPVAAAAHPAKARVIMSKNLTCDIGSPVFSIPICIPMRSSAGGASSSGVRRFSGGASSSGGAREEKPRPPRPQWRP